MTHLYLLDTNMVSYILKGKSASTRARLAGLISPQAACISVISEAELPYGLAKSGAGEQRRRAFEWFLARIKVEPWNSGAAGAYGGLRAAQESIGKPLGALDTLIAAHAIALAATLVTNDNAFHSVGKLLNIENWATDL